MNADASGERMRIAGDGGTNGHQKGVCDDACPCLLPFFMMNAHTDCVAATVERLAR